MKVKSIKFTSMNLKTIYLIAFGLSILIIGYLIIPSVYPVDFARISLLCFTKWTGRLPVQPKLYTPRVKEVSGVAAEPSHSARSARVDGIFVKIVHADRARLLC